MSRLTRKPVQIIDHEPLDGSSSHQKSGGFGKRNQKTATGTNASDSDYRPFEKNGISAYFIDRVQKHQQNRDENKGKLNRSAIRDVSPDHTTETGESGIPYVPLAAVVALAFAIPMAFVFVTENFTPTNIDPMTTASVRTADGLEVREISMTKILKNGTFVVSVHGQVANRADKAKSLLPLTISLRDKDGNEVQTWRHQVGNSALKENGKIRFMTSAIDYSGNAETAHVIARAAR